MKKIKICLMLGVAALLLITAPASAYGSLPLGQTAFATGEIEVNGRPISAPRPSVTGGVIMLPLRAISESLGLKVEWDGYERRVDIGGVYAIWIGRPIISRDGGQTTSEFGPAPEIIDGRTFVPISFFNFGISGVSAEIEEGIVKVSRNSIHWNVVKLPDMQINLWAYSLPRDFTSDDGHAYETIYNIAPHKAGGVTAIWTDTVITNFELIAIELETPPGREGILRFEQGDTLLSLPAFTPDRPLAFSTHWGTMPRIGITFIDEQGQRHYFSITQSGMDGRIEILPFPIDEGIYI